MIRIDFALIVVLACSWSWPGHSSDDTVSHFNMGIIGLEPYAIEQQDAPHTGYMVDIAKEIRNHIGIPGDDVVLPLKRLHAHLKTGKVDCAVFARVAMTEGAYELVAPLGKEIQSVIVPKTGVVISSYDDL